MDSKDNPFLYILRLPVKTPYSVIITVIIVHVISFLLPWRTDLSTGIKLAVCCFVISSLGYYFYLLTRKQGVKELVLNAEDEWAIIMMNGEKYSAELGSTQFVHPKLVILSLKLDNRTAFFVFTSEIIAPDIFRRLRVRLRFKLDYKM